MLLLHNPMGIYPTKCCYWISLYNLRCNNLAVTGIICICVDFISDFLQPTIALQTNTWLDISAIAG